MSDDGDLDPYEVVPALRMRNVRRVRRVALAALGSFLAVTLMFGCSQWRYLQRVNPPGDPLAAATFEVVAGDDLTSVSERLHDLGFVVDAGTFRRYAKNEGGLDVVPGYYTLRPRDHLGNLLRTLRIPPDERFIKVTIPEGFTIVQIAARLATSIPGFSADDFVARAAAPVDGPVSKYAPSPGTSLEGLVFPDTYSIAADEKPVQVLQRMVRLMERVGRQEGLDDSETLVGFTPYQVLVVASLIEREARVPADRPKIARVIYNRLALGMNLEIDASLYYGQDPSIDFATLKQIMSPYNTYLNPGLPPTPIANPGRAAIAAALSPASDPAPNSALCRDLAPGQACRYLYYVLSNEDGNHAFAATLEQHQANVEAARQAGVL